MNTVLEVTAISGDLPVVIGLLALAVLLLALGFVRGVGKSRPHAK